MSNISFSGTYAKLLAGLQTLTSEQLARPIEANTETQLFSDVSLEITTEEHFYADGEWQGTASDLDAEEQASCEHKEAAGRVYLSLE